MAKPQIVNKDSIVIPVGTMEDFKRPNHPDFALSSELKEQKWSGLRHNSLTDTAELWILGEVRGTVSKAQIQLDPLAINKMYEEVFMLDNILPDIVELREIQEKMSKGLY